MILRRLNKIVQTDDPERIRQYKLLGFTESMQEPEPSGQGREPEPEHPTDPKKEPKRARAAKTDEEL